MLPLRNYQEELKLGGAKTMTEMVDRFHRSLDELVQRGAHQGQTMVLRRVIARRFGEETAGKVSEMLEGLSGADGIDRVTDPLFECGTSEEFIARVRTRTGLASTSQRIETAYGVDGCRKGWF